MTRSRMSRRPRDNKQASSRQATTNDSGEHASKRDWAAIWLTVGAIAIAGLPGIAALITVFPTIQATDTQLQIAQLGQITDSYNAAITNLGSSNIDVRLGGIYALQRLMNEAPSDQSMIVDVLCAFVRDESAVTAKVSRSAPRVPTDVQAAVTVVMSRNYSNDHPTILVDFDHSDLVGVTFTVLATKPMDQSASDVSLGTAIAVHLTGANFTGTDLAGANFVDAKLAASSMSDANLQGATLLDTDLHDSDLTGANLSNARLVFSNLSYADLTGVNLNGANLNGANLTGANLNGAVWPSGSQPPTGWTRGLDGKLQRTAG